MSMHEAPACPGDGFRMVWTIVGWRCPVCGLAVLKSADDGRARAKAAHPSARAR